MNRKRNYLIFIIVITVIVSCQKSFLTVTPLTSLANETFYKTEDQFTQAINAAYTPLRGVVHAAIYMDEMRSDNTFYTRFTGNRGLENSTESLSEFLDDANSSALDNSPGNRYGICYSGIANANAILTYITEADLSQGFKDSTAAEALFLRAFYYFDLVTHYGGVPLQLTVITDPQQSFQPRNTIDEVYKQIVDDLQQAIPNLAVPSTFPQSGRATQGAAKMLLAYAYMTKPEKEYAKAESELIDITHMNYELLSDYASVFDPATGKNSAESIFEVQYMSDLTSGQQSNFAWIFAPKTTNPYFLMGYSGSVMNVYSGWNVPTQEMVDSYETGDKRLDASIAVVEGTISGVEDFTATAIESAEGYEPDSKTAYRYMIKKYYHPPYIADFNTPDNWPIFRYSGALLLLAECLVEQGKNADALPYLNEVRTRAGLSPQTAATKDNVAEETRHELAFENHRWTDLVRIGEAIPVCIAKGERLKAIYQWLRPTSFQVTQGKLIFPIPAREIQINNLLTQNPGY